MLVQRVTNSRALKKINASQKARPRGGKATHFFCTVCPCWTRLFSMSSEYGMELDNGKPQQS